jgi:hypothetical protein
MQRIFSGFFSTNQRINGGRYLRAKNFCFEPTIHSVNRPCGKPVDEGWSPCVPASAVGSEEKEKLVEKN